MPEDYSRFHVDEVFPPAAGRGGRESHGRTRPGMETLDPRRQLHLAPDPRRQSFLAFNNTYGHQDGDRALQGVATCLAGRAQCPGYALRRRGVRRAAAGKGRNGCAGHCRAHSRRGRAPRYSTCREPARALDRQRRSRHRPARDRRLAGQPAANGRSGPLWRQARRSHRVGRQGAVLAAASERADPAGIVPRAA